MKLAVRHWSIPVPSPVGLMIASWLVASGVGLGMFWQYKTTGQEPLRTVVNWPEQTELTLADDRQTLVMFAHPRCPCTMASVRELKGVLQKSEVQPRVLFVLYLPASAGPEWRSSPLIAAARALPGVRIVWDSEGNLAKQFAAATSGQVQLYTPLGKCLFNGGVTRARGHEGENAASRALLSALQSQESALLSGPIYGCDL